MGQSIEQMGCCAILVYISVLQVGLVTDMGVFMLLPLLALSKTSCSQH